MKGAAGVEGVEGLGSRCDVRALRRVVSINVRELNGLGEDVFSLLEPIEQLRTLGMKPC